MFGHDDKPKDDNHDESDSITAVDDQVVQPDPNDHQAKDDAGRDNSWQPPAPSTPSDDTAADASDTKTDETPATPSHTPFSLTPEPASDDSNDDLIDIKQEALGKLSPLIGHLDQSPDEKFRTLMMMIQASDDQSLVKQAYETALKIDEEKTRAQALLDIVNEINYFTQNPKN